MYLNRKNIELINEVRRVAEARGLTFAQTNSRRNGNYLDACRIYQRPDEKGKPKLALWTGRSEKDFADYLGY